MPTHAHKLVADVALDARGQILLVKYEVDVISKVVPQ